MFPIQALHHHRKEEKSSNKISFRLSQGDGGDARKIRSIGFLPQVGRLFQMDKGLGDPVAQVGRDRYLIGMWSDAGLRPARHVFCRAMTNPLISFPSNFRFFFCDRLKNHEPRFALLFFCKAAVVPWADCAG